MARYLSVEWFDEVNEAASRSSALKGATTGVNLVIQQVVTDTAQGELRYWLRIGDGSVEASLGTPPGGQAAAHATVTQSYETAAAVMRGELSPEEAFLGGRIRLRGDIGVLLRHQNVLSSLGQAFDEVHQRTEYH